MIKNKPKLYLFGIDGGVRDYVRKHAEAGDYPNFKRVMDNGCFFTDCMTTYPSITPTCWASIATGTTPNRHGAVDQDMRKPGGDPCDFWTAYDSAKCTAERFWETIVKQGGRALVMDYVTSGPARMDNVWQVASFPEAKGPVMRAMDRMVGGHLSEYGGCYVIGAQTYEISFDKIEDEDVSGALRFQTPSGPWQPLAREDAFINQTVSETNDYVLPVINRGRLAEWSKMKPIEWRATVCDDGVLFSYDGCEKPQFIREGEWTEYIERELPTTDGQTFRYTFRAKLTHFDFEKREFGIFMPLAVPKRLYVSPEEFSAEFEKLSVIPDHSAGSRVVREVPDIDTFIELQYMSADCHKKAIECAFGLRDFDVVADVLGFTDTMNHAFKSFLEGVQPTDEFMMQKTEELYFRGYKVLDDYVGWLLDNVIGEDTTFVIIGDHGAVGFDTVIHPHDILEKAGLMKWLPGGEREKNRTLVDWSQTKAYPVMSGHIFLNLTGRDPHGIVEPEDYDKVVNEVIIALQEGLRDNGTVALAFAVENSQAGFVGQGGERAGDVVYGLTGSRIGGSIGGVHACQIPSARTKGGDIRSICMMMGPMFKQGEIIDRPMDLTDVAPTIMYAAGYPMPADATGGVVFQAFGDKDNVFNKR